jgi:hypothetical protein
MGFMKTFEDFYFNLDKEERLIVERLRKLVLETDPRFKEKISYGVPYYFLNSRVCFIWPSSVKPGPKSGVVLGFCMGYLLSNIQGLLEKENRQQVYLITFHDVKEIEEAVLREIIIEAILTDQQIYTKKKNKDLTKRLKRKHRK